MSINSSVQQLSSGLASIIAGLIVIDQGGTLERYNYVGYFAIVITIVCILLGQKIKSVESAGNAPAMKEEQKELAKA